MIDIHQVLKKASRLDLSHWRRLVLLSIGAFLLGMGFVFFDVGAVSMLLQKNNQHAIGFDFLIVALFSVWVGSLYVKLDRRHGYGGVPLTFFLTIILLGILKAIISFPDSSILINTLFVYKYVMPVLVGVSFWTIAHRFIVLKFNSLKYMGVLAAFLLGILFSGFSLSADRWTSVQALKGAIYSFLGLTVVMKILVLLLPQPTEVFIRKTGGVQDSSEQKLINCILILAFTYTTARFLGDFLLYRSLYLSFNNIITPLSLLWAGCGGFGFIALVVLSRTRFLYTTLWGLLTLCLGIFLLAGGSFLKKDWVVYIGAIITWICGFFYWKPYLSLLPRPLTLGIGIRLRKKRQMVAEPLGCLLAGALILSVSKLNISLILMGISLLLALFIFGSIALYNQLLTRLFKIRLWCGGPLMLTSKKLVNRVKSEANSDSSLDVIYFLRVMEVAHFPGFQKQLIKSLQHSNSDVRLFALDKLEAHGFYKPSVISMVQKVFQKDSDRLVRARALAFLIHYENDYESSDVYHKYGSYLDDKNLKIGAIMGFLQSGGEWALLAMEGLQNLILSPKKEDNLSALMIIDKVPQKGLVRLVLPLLKSPYSEVVRSALLVAGRIGHVQTLSFVFQQLDNPEFQEEALQALLMYGKIVFPPLEKMLSNQKVPLSRRKNLISFLGLLPSGEGKQVLLRNLYLPDIKMRKEIFKAVLNSKITWISKSRKKLLTDGIKKDVKWWESLQKARHICRYIPTPALGDSFSFLRRSFEEMQQDLRELILDQLLLLKSNSLVRKSIAILQDSPSQKFISSVSILQDLLPAKVYHLVRPVLLSPLAETEEEKEVSLDTTQAKYFLEQLILAPDFPVDRWMIASALYGLQKIGDDHSKIVLDKAFLSSSEVVLEAAVELLEHLESNKKQQENYLNAQIHKIPKNLILEDYLNKRRENDYL